MLLDNFQKTILDKYFSQFEPVANIVLPSKLEVNTVAPKFKAVSIGTNKAIWYEDDAHVYFILDYISNVRIPLLSTTTGIHVYSKPFEKEKMSLLCSQKLMYEAKCLDNTDWGNKTIQQRQRLIKQAWEDNNKEATEYGTYAHAIMEALTRNPNANVDECVETMSQRFNRFHCYITKFAHIYKENHLLPLIKDGWTIIAEPIVYLLSALTGGQSDVVAIHHGLKKIKILDFKTNEEHPKRKRVYNKMLGKLAHLDDTDYPHYAIQLCMYQNMVHSLLPDYTLDVNELLWLDRENEVIEVIPVIPEEWQRECAIVTSDLMNVKEYVYEKYQLH